MLQIHINEMIAWGDLGFYLCLPWQALGGNFIRVIGTEEQKKLLMKKFKQSQAYVGLHGVDRSALRFGFIGNPHASRAGRRQLGAQRREAVCDHRTNVADRIGWAPGCLGHNGSRLSASRGSKPLSWRPNTPGVKITKLEKKLGLRASDTAVVIFEDCRIPLKNLAGRPGQHGIQGRHDHVRFGAARRRRRRRLA